MDLFITTAHRISCSILQRTAQEDEAVTDKVKQTEKNTTTTLTTVQWVCFCRLYFC